MTDDAKTDGAAAPLEWTRREMKGIPASLGALWTRRGENNEWRYAVQLDKSHANAQGLVHGGVLMTFMDHAMALLIWEATDRAMTSTVHLDSHFLSSVRPPAFVECDGQILRRGKNLIFARGILRVEGKDVFEATGVWSILSATGA
jgi:acyl-coenzyme A thioesterase PaaI-like protein